LSLANGAAGPPCVYSHGAAGGVDDQSKSAVADFDHSIDGPKPAYTRFRLGAAIAAFSR
jgi:hypothetical protein